VRRTLAILSGALVAGAGLLGSPAPAPAAVLGVQDDRLTSGPVERVPARMALLRASGAKVTRIDVLWSLVAPRRPADPTDPEDPAYRWERTDATLRGIAALGVTPIVVAYSAPSWAAGGRGTPPGTEVNPNAPSAADYGRFMRALATRYTGTHRPAGQAEPLPRVRHFEIWNEPNLAGFLAPQVSGGRRVAVTRYVQMLRRAYPAITRANPGAIVIAGAGGPRSSTDARGTGALAWARAIAASGAPFDAFSQHVYPAAAPLAPTRAFPAWKTLPSLFAALDAVPRRRGTPVYLTEVGYTTAATPFRTVRVTAAQQARYLRQLVGLPAVRSGRVRAVIWFNLQDNPNWPGGLRRETGRAKPSHAVFRALARRSRRTADLLVRPPVALSRAQLLINQRISQAAVRRANGLEARLRAGLTGGDVRPGAIDATRLAGGLTITGATGAPAAPTLTPIARGRAGDPRDVRLSRTQLGTNQRIAQAGVRRANALAARLAEGLTAADFRPGSITAVNLDPDLRD
jgi:hypothetical protein